MTKFIMHGCNGAMGQVITRLAKDTPDVEIVAGIDVNDSISNDYPVFKSLEECDVKQMSLLIFPVQRSQIIWWTMRLNIRFPLYCVQQDCLKSRFQR